MERDAHNRSQDPLQCVGQALPEMIAGLQRISPDELEPLPSGDIQPFTVCEATEAVAYRPTSMMATTVDEADLAHDHPDIEVPGVVLETYLGGGGQGWVYAARVRSTGAVVAVKVLRADYLAAKGYAAREALLCSRVHHPNILRVFHTQSAGPFWVVLMELIQGEELHSHRHNPDDLKPALAQIADALCQLKNHSIVHCDIKPSNILLRRRDKSPVLVDFGIAVDLGEEAERTSLSGTPYFMAPEAIESGQPSNAWDAYSLGVTAAFVLGVRHTYDTFEAIRETKRSGSFHRTLSAGIQQIADDQARDYMLALINDDPDVRLAALETTKHFLSV